MHFPATALSLRVLESPSHPRRGVHLVCSTSARLDGGSQVGIVGDGQLDLVADQRVRFHKVQRGPCQRNT